ncbi:NB-ARC domain-containing protein [Streptomyces sp. NPDC060209]|uniref:NB-ARC domain-containing protein n=1 Tax=Streptomyces sp. NPDC060209 TaxID=3347073 RepID=UPI003651AA1C
MDFGTPSEREALDRLRDLFRRLKASSGFTNRRAATVCGLSLRTFVSAVGPDSDPARHLPTYETSLAILRHLGATPVQDEEARSWLIKVEDWRRRRKHPCVMLPPKPDVFAGRDEDIEALMSWLGAGANDENALTLMGMGGVGKTALAVAAAHRGYEEGWFAGGALCVDLHSYSPAVERGPEEVLDILLRALKYKAPNWPVTLDEKIGAWNEALRRREAPLLLLLDNVRTAGQVELIIPPLPHHTLITTRNKISTLRAKPYAVRELSHAGSVGLLKAVAQADGVQDTRITEDSAAATRIAGLCGDLPLALRIIGALLRDEPERPLRDMAEELAERREERLAAFQHEDLAVRTSLDLSYDRLPSRERLALHLLAAAPGVDISTDCVGPLFGMKSPRHLLANLDRAHLLRNAGGERWAFHDLVRLFANEPDIADTWESERSDALPRLFAHYLHHAAHAEALLTPDMAEHIAEVLPDLPEQPYPHSEKAVSWLDAEVGNVLACATAGISADTPIRRWAPFFLGTYLLSKARLSDLLQLTNASVEDLPKDLVLGAWPYDLLLLHGQALLMNDEGESAAFYLTAVANRPDVPDSAVSAALTGLSIVLLRRGEPEQAAAMAERASRAAAASGDPMREADARLRSAAAELRANDARAALRGLDGVIGTYAAYGRHGNESEARVLRAKAFMQLNQLADAVTDLRAAVALGHPFFAVDAHARLGMVLHLEGRCSEAGTHLLEAADRFMEQGRHSDAGMYRGVYGFCLIKQGRWAEGESLCRQVVQDAERRGDHRLAEATAQTLAGMRGPSGQPGDPDGSP